MARSSSFLKPGVKPARRSDKKVSRRDFLRGSGAAAASLAATVAMPLPALAHKDRHDDEPLFRHGVASGDPLSDRVILWTRVTPDSRRRRVSVRYRVARDPGMRHVVERGEITTDASRDFTVKVDVKGLRAGRTYYYQFFVEDEESPVGRTRTLPRHDVERLRMAVVSCSNLPAGYFNAYRRIAERADLDVVIHLGDYLYEYGADEYGSVRTPEPATEMVTLSDYRTRHAQYKRDPDLQEVHRQHPFICIWDDHEITNDAWIGGAENHTEGAEGAWPERVKVGLKAYYEWMPVRQPDPKDPRRQQRAFSFGDLVDLAMLEERLQARSQQLPATIPTDFGNGFVQAGPFADPARTLLGAEQEAWLKDYLRGSRARWKFIGQGVMFAQLKLVGAPLAAGGGVFLNSDQWDGYQPARNRIYDVFKGDATHPPVGNCVLLTGDIHSSWAADLSQDPNNPDLATGGYNPATGEGSRAVEFVGTSVSSPGVNDPGNGIAGLLRTINPHFKHIDLNQRGYMLVDVTRERAVCEWWYVDTVAAASSVESLGVALQVAHGSNRLAVSSMTTPREDAPPLAS